MVWSALLCSITKTDGNNKQDIFVSSWIRIDSPRLPRPQEILLLGE
jgi:hypothetical protein